MAYIIIISSSNSNNYTLLAIIINGINHDLLKHKGGLMLNNLLHLDKSLPTKKKCGGAVLYWAWHEYLGKTKHVYFTGHSN